MALKSKTELLQKLGKRKYDNKLSASDEYLIKYLKIDQKTFSHNIKLRLYYYHTTQGNY